MSLPIDLLNKVALVTGVTDGIGQGVALMMARAGCDVIGCGRSQADSDGARRFIECVGAEGRTACYQVADVTRRDDLERLVEEGVKALGRLDIVVSNAGAAAFHGSEACTEEQWQANLDLNFSSHWRLAQIAKPHLDLSGSGVVIIMGSNHAYATIPGCFPYSTTKAGLLGLVQSLAIEWGSRIRTVGVAPGFIATKQNENWFASFPDAEAERKRTEGMHPVGRLGTVEEVGALCAFLASPLAGFATGTTYLFDGGRSALMQDD